MAFAETRARELERPETRLFTNARMEGNLALYRRLGYSETQHEQLPDRVLVHMSKSVARDPTQEGFTTEFPPTASTRKG
jgi:hypothetical protein